MNRTLSTNSETRKGVPLFSGVLKYFPAALAGMARWSVLGNNKHNPGQPLHHSRGKSSDHADCIMRHLTDLADLEVVYDRHPIEFGSMEDRYLTEQVLNEVDALAWRACALSQELHEKYGGAPIAPAAKMPEVPAGTKTRKKK